MGRPKAVNIKTFHLYDKLHTKKTKMMSGVEMTTLYPIKETEHFYMSHEVWAYCASKFKAKKKGFELSVNIPTITDEKTIDFLKEEAWHDWTEKEKMSSEMQETLSMLNKLFPEHKKVFFYELNSILSTFNHGTFLSYDENGNIKEPSEHDLKRRKNFTHKYHKHAGMNIPEIKEALDAYRAVERGDKSNKEQEKLATEKYRIYHDLEADYVYKNMCLDNVFINIGKNSVCYPVAFSRSTADWSKDKYGKLIGYAHAGEIYFVVTPDTVYFETSRHY